MFVMKILLILSMLLPMISAPDTTVQDQQSADSTVVTLTLHDALKIAMSENVSVKVADKEIQRTKYAKRGAYAALFPQADITAAFQRTIKKQVMYIDFDMAGAMGGGATEGDIPSDQGGQTKAGGSGGGIEVGRWNTWNAGLNVAMPLVNAQLWESLKISGDDVELAVEKARGSRLAMVTSVKEAFFGVLLAKDANQVYEQALKNAQHNLNITQMRYSCQKASEMDLMRAKTTVANAIPDVYNSRNNILLALWRLKAVMGVDLGMNIDVDGSLADYTESLFYDVHQHDEVDLSKNSSLRQMEIQIGELAKLVRVNSYAYIPTLAVNFSYSYNAMANDFHFKEYKWTPYSYVGLALQIPIFSGGKRYHAIKESKVQLSQVKLQKEQAERELTLAVRSYLSTMETNMNSYYAALSAVDSATKGYDITSTSYEVGRSTLVELNDALLAKAQAELMKWQSIYSYLLAKAGLEEQLGSDFTGELQ